MDSLSPRPRNTALDALADLAPMIAAHRQAMDRDRRLPAPLYEALADAGLFRLWLPLTLGGPELSPVDFMDVVERASALDGTVGWLIGNGAGMSRIAGYLPEPVAREWFADPRSFVVSATGAVGSAVPVPGGYKVTGRWPFGSGAHHADRFMGLCSIQDGDPQLRICCHVARADVTVIDNWHVSGLRGSGSCDFEVREAFVPAEHVHEFFAPAPRQPGSLYRLPNICAFPWSIAGVPLGIARAAIDCLAGIAMKKTRAGSSSPLAEREMAQSKIGEAEALYGAARAFLCQAMGELMVAMDGPPEGFLLARGGLRLALAHAADSSVAIVDSMARLAGSAAIFETFALERCVRDVHAAVKHVAMAPANYILYGRLRLGLDPGTNRF